MDKRGSTAAATGVLMTALVGAAGLAVDSTRLWLVETRLRTAVDAAALTAARRLNEPNRDAEAIAIFYGHFSRVDGRATYLGATIGAPGIAQDAADRSRIRIQATATVPMSLLGVLSSAPVTRTEAATAQRAGLGLELAIVLDQTASMRQAAGDGGTKLDAARRAVHAMLDVLYAGRDTQQNLWVSVVPFARTINIGTRNAHMLDTSNMGTGWNLSNWSGCVEARLNGHDLTDAAPTGPGRFRPYFWPSTYRLVGSTANGRCTTSNAYAAVGGVRYCHGDNDWGVSTAPTQNQLNGNFMYSDLRNAGMTHAESIGPNLLCAYNPIQPLTASRTAVNAALAAIVAPVRSGGTTTPVGLQGAWYTLSPNWQGMWQNPNAGLPNQPTLPLPYGTPNMRKIVVILTDGDNNWQPAYGENNNATCGSSSRSVCSSATGTELLYNAYGRVEQFNARNSDSRISPVTQANADTRLDQRFTAICNAMKAPGTGIVVYVVGFQVAAAHRSRLQSCATSTQHYFESPTTAQLQTVFQQVGNQLASVRMVD